MPVRYQSHRFVRHWLSLGRGRIKGHMGSRCRDEQCFQRISEIGFGMQKPGVGHVPLGLDMILAGLNSQKNGRGAENGCLHLHAGEVIHQQYPRVVVHRCR